MRSRIRRVLPLNSMCSKTVRQRRWQRQYLRLSKARSNPTKSAPKRLILQDFCILPPVAKIAFSGYNMSYFEPTVSRSGLYP